MVQFFLESDRVAGFVTHLQGQMPVFAPHPKGDTAFVFGAVEDPRMVVLDYPRTMHSIKKYFLPPREKLLNFDLTDNTYEAPTAEPVNAIFLGVHSYDVEAVQRLDYNFSQGQPERNYLTRRQGAVFIGVSYEPDPFHFAGSVGIDPQDSRGCDIFLTKLLDGYVLEVLTEKGAELVAGFDLSPYEARKPAAGNFQQHVYLPQAKLNKVMEKSYDSSIWEETARKCVGCGTCNVVCPTCYCFNVEEQVDITVTRGHRERIWDGCMLREFSEVAGGEVFRDSLAARQRHRVFRKFKYLSAETGQPWCVGCGRCTALCTAKISIVSMVNHLVADYERTVATPL